MMAMLFPTTGAAEIVNSGPPWVYWGQGVSAEKWAALVDDSSLGLGVLQ